MDETQIQQKHRKDEENATRLRAQVLGFRYFDMQTIEDNIELHEDVLSLEEIKQNNVIPLEKGEGRTPYKFGVTSKTPQSFIRQKRQEYQDQGQNIEFLLISDSSFRNMLVRYDPPILPHYDDIKIAGDGDSATLQAVSNILNRVRVDELFDFLIIQAEKLGASDIHIENMRNTIRIRMRVDGALHPVAEIDRERYRIIIGELSSRASLSIAVKKPQSSGINMDLKREDGSQFILNLRVEMVPTMYGMDAVLRLFNFDQSLLNLDLLGLDQKSRQEIEEIISHPRGLVLLVGPTGSGKSTTLYSILNALNNTSRKIITLEDPIEYTIKGISQIPVNVMEKKSFSDGLRSILRLDPDVVMVGEIRDQDTAKTAIQASITGHLVMSSFHADSASAAFTRIIDMIGFNPIFISSVRLIIAQRLVRKLVNETKQSYEPTLSEQNWVIEQLKNVPDAIKSPYLTNMKLYRAIPTENYPFGYQGRVVVMEQLIVDSSIQSYLQSGKMVTSDKIEALAKNNGMLTLKEKAVLLALQGITTIDEVNRIL